MYGTVHVLAGDASDDPIALQVAAERGEQTGWYVIKSSEPGDLAIVSIRGRGLVAVARQMTPPVFEANDGQAKYKAQLGEIELIEPPISDEDLLEILPDWKWLQGYSRTKVKPSPDVADALIGLIQARRHMEEDLAQPDDDPGIAPDAYARALERLDDQLTSAQRDLLVLLAYAPGATLTLPQLTQVTGRKAPYAAYGVLGQVSSRLGQALQVTPGEARLRTRLVAVDRRDADGTWMLSLYDALAQAVRTLGWMPSNRWVLSPEAIAEQPAQWDGTSATRLATAQVTLLRERLRRELARRGLICAITGERSPVALREVPIKPWRDCDPGEHLHPDNYLVLTSALAEAFTAGRWSLDDEGQALRSSSLSQAERQLLSPEDAPVTTRLTAKQRIFLMHHRAFVFQPD